MTHANITVLRGPEVLWRGRIVSHVIADPGEYIYEGTDNFVNYCIDDARPIRSQAHRLYCFQPGLSDRWVTLTAR